MSTCKSNPNLRRESTLFSEIWNLRIAILGLTGMAVGLAGSGQFLDIYRAFVLEPQKFQSAIFWSMPALAIFALALLSAARLRSPLTTPISETCARSCFATFTLLPAGILAVALFQAAAEVPALDERYAAPLFLLARLGVILCMAVIGSAAYLTSSSGKAFALRAWHHIDSLTTPLRWLLLAVAGLFIGVSLMGPSTLISVSTFFGPVAIVLLGISVHMAAFTWLAERSYSLRWPVTMTIIGVIVLFHLLGFNDNRFLRKTTTTQSRLVLGEALEEWIAARKDALPSGKALPMILVAMQGGGLYAARHGSAVLSRLQDECPAFAQHIFAISGVSGGSLGAAVFASAVASQAPMIKPRDCKPTGQTVFQNYAARFLEADLLSPVLWTWLIPDVVHQLLPTPTGEQLSRAVAQERTFEAREAAAGGSQSTGLFRKLMLDARPFGTAVPYLVLNATRVSTGEQINVSPISLMRVNSPDRASLHWYAPNWDFPVSVAVGVSARFPLVVPTARLRIERAPARGEGEQITMALVDGGYAENSGLDSARKLYERIAEAVRSRRAIVEAYARMSQNILSILQRANAQPSVLTGVINDAERTLSSLERADAALQARSDLGTTFIQRGLSMTSDMKGVLQSFLVPPHNTTTAIEKLSAARATIMRVNKGEPTIHLIMLGIAEGSLLTSGFLVHQDREAKMNDDADFLQEHPDLAPAATGSDASHLLTPLMVLNSTRVHRAAAAMTDFAESLRHHALGVIKRDRLGFVPVTLTNSRGDIPLAWLLSRLTHDRIALLRAAVPENGGGLHTKDGSENCILNGGPEERATLRKFGETIEATQDRTLLRCWLRNLREAFR